MQIRGELWQPVTARHKILLHGIEFGFIQPRRDGVRKKDNCVAVLPLDGTVAVHPAGHVWDQAIELSEFVFHREQTVTVRVETSATEISNSCARVYRHALWTSNFKCTAIAATVE